MTWPIWDTELFLWINNGWSHPVLDAILPLLREKLFWVPLYVFVLSFMAFNMPLKRFGIICAMVVVTIATSDGVSSSFLKPKVGRDRPCQNIELKDEVILRARCGAGKSFTSSHATNHFALATLLFFICGASCKFRWLWWVWAASISISQVYVGVHYPIDITAGGVLGFLIGWIVFKAGSFWLQRDNLSMA